MLCATVQTYLLDLALQHLPLLKQYSDCLLGHHALPHHQSVIPAAPASAGDGVLELLGLACES